MSCYEWERAEITIPSKDYPSFRRKMLEAWNAEQDRLFDLAKRAHDTILAQAKGKRGFDKHKALARLFGRWLDGEAHVSATYPFNDGDDYEPVNLLLFGEWDEAYKRAVVGKFDNEKRAFVHFTVMHAPRKKDLAYKPVSKGCTLDLPDATLSFDDDKRQVQWDVGENNHACENARKHTIARTFFKALDAIVWTRGSGGNVVGNDEYRRDSRGEGDGANYVKDSYGPERSKRKQRDTDRWSERWGRYTGMGR